MTDSFDTSESRPPPTSGEPGTPPSGPPAPAQQPSSRGPAAGAWSARRTLGALGAFLVLVILEATVVAAFDPDIDSLGARLALQGLLGVTLLAVAFAAARPGPGLFAAPVVLGLRRPLRKPLGAALIAYFGYIACALVIAALLEPEQEDVTRELGVDEGTFGSIAAGVLIIGLAPITEEVFFRGFMFGGIRRAAPFALAALVSAAIWGLFHYTGPDSWGVVLQLAVFGLWLAWLYERTGSLWPPIAVHTFNNAVAFALLTA